MVMFAFTNIFILCFVTQDMDLHITYFLSLGFIYYSFSAKKSFYVANFFEDHRMYGAKGNMKRKNLCMCALYLLTMCRR